MNNTNYTRDEFEKLMNRFDEEIKLVEDVSEYISNDFEFQGIRLDTLELLVEYREKLSKVLDCRNNYNKNFTSAVSKIDEELKKDNVYTEEIHYMLGKKKIELEKAFCKLESRLIERHKSKNVNEINIIQLKGNVFQVYVKCKEISNEIIEEFMKATPNFKIIEIQDENVYKIYKDCWLKNVSNRTEELKGLIDFLYELMMKDKVYRELIYDDFIDDIVSRLYPMKEEKNYKLDLNGKELYKWQVEAYKKWRENKCKGIFEVATGAGKTIFALSAVEKVLKEREEVRVKIIAPTIPIMQNWYKNLRDKLHIPIDEIGRMGGGKKERNRKFTVYVSNTAQREFPSDIIAIEKMNYEKDMDIYHFIIADECHHYISAENIKIFKGLEGIGEDPDTGINYYSIGLTATLPDAFKEDGDEGIVERKQNSILLEKALGEKRFEYDFLHALADDVISPFIILDVQCKLSSKDNAEYFLLNRELRHLKEEFGYILNKYDIAYVENKILFTAYFYVSKEEKLIKSSTSVKSKLKKQYGNEEGEKHFKQWVFNSNDKDMQIAIAANNCINKYNEIKRLIFEVEDRKTRCLEFIEKHINDRVIVFAEYIKDLEVIYEELVEYYGREKIKLYHSGMNEKEKRDSLNLFNEGKANVICTAKAIDEGVDITDANIAIVYQSSKSTRQQVQRLGRIIRKAENKEFAMLYHLYCHGYIERRFLDYYFSKKVNIENQELRNKYKVAFEKFGRYIIEPVEDEEKQQQGQKDNGDE